MRVCPGAGPASFPGPAFPSVREYARPSRGVGRPKQRLRRVSAASPGFPSRQRRRCSETALALVAGQRGLRSIQPCGTAVDTAPPRLCSLAPSLMLPQVARLQTSVDWWADPQGVPPPLPRTVTESQNDGLTPLPKPLGWRDDRHGVFTPGPSASKRTIVCLNSMPAGGDTEFSPPCQHNWVKLPMGLCPCFGTPTPKFINSARRHAAGTNDGAL